MKILQLGKFYPVKGGVEKVMYELTLGLSEQENDCDMMCANAERGSSRIRLNGHSQIICTDTWLKLAGTMVSPGMIVTLRKECNNYDVIHIHCPDPMAVLALMLSGYKGKVVLHWHSDVLKQHVLMSLYRPLQNWIIRRADRIVCTTPVMRQESEYLHEVQDKAVVIPIGIDPMEIKQKNVKSLRKQFKGKKIVFSLGRLVPYKGYTYLIQAAKYLPDDYVIIIGGEGPLWDKLQKEIGDNGLLGKVCMTGFIANEERQAYYGACDVFCMSSILKTEAFGIVQIEAMSCGKPIVATNIGCSGVSWVNKHGVSGLNVAPMDPKALAEAIVAVVEDSATYSKQSLNRYFSLFTKERMISSCYKLYQELLDQKTEFLQTGSTDAISESFSAFSHDSAFTVRNGLKLRCIDRQFLIVDNNTDNLNYTRVYELNETAAWIWQKANDGKEFTADELTELIAERYDIDREAAYADIVRQLLYWKENGLITLVENVNEQESD